MALEQISLNSIPAPGRHVIYIAIMLVVAGMWYWLFQKPLNEELAAINVKNERLRVQLRQAESVRAQYDQYQKDLAEIDARLRVLQTVLPTGKEAAAFLRTVQEMAAASKLEINLFRPRAPISRDFYFDWPVEVRLEGNYHGLGRFFESIGQAQRIVDVPIVTINNIKNQTDPNWTIIATGTVTTYIQDSLDDQIVIEEE